MARGDVHVVPTSGGWCLHVEGEARPLHGYRPRAEAIQAGREAAKRTERKPLVQGRCRIRWRNTYGKSPTRSME
jgi:hypothetical protein